LTSTKYADIAKDVFEVFLRGNRHNANPISGGDIGT
jgi:hypothetical protein